MIDINLLPEERRSVAAAPSHTGGAGSLLALGVGLAALAAVAFFNLYYTYSVIPDAKRRVAEREAVLAAHAASEAKLDDAQALLAERVRRVDTVKTLLAGRSSRAGVLSDIKDAVARADASVPAGEGILRLTSIDIRGDGLVLDGLVAGAADAPAREAVEALARELGGRITLLEPQSDSPPPGHAGVWRFFVEADVR